MVNEIVIDGTDGAGKTTLAKTLTYVLKNKDYRVVNYAPFRVREVYPLWEKDPIKAAQIIHDVMKDFRETNTDVDFIIWDRGWPTVYVSTKNEKARNLLLPFPSLTILLLGTIEKTNIKVEELNLTEVWLTNEELLIRYNKEYRQLPEDLDAPILSYFLNSHGLFNYNQIIEDILSKFEK